jgi:hypothetical protein
MTPHARNARAGSTQNPGDRVLSGLCASAHHDEVAIGRSEHDAGPAGAGLEHKPTRRAESQYGDYAFVPFARRLVAVPPGAVVVVAVEVDPNAVIGNAVVVRQTSRQHGQQRFGVDARSAYSAVSRGSSTSRLYIQPRRCSNGTEATSRIRRLSA